MDSSEHYRSEDEIVTIEMSEIGQDKIENSEGNEMTVKQLNGGEGGCSEDQPVAVVKTEGNTKSSRHFKRVELCMADKVKVIMAGSTGRSQRQLAKEFGISKTQVQCLLKRKDEILGYYKAGLDSWRKRSKLRRNSSEEINERVIQWYKGQNDEAITGPMIQAKAIEITQELGLSNVFKASNGWLDSFKRRYDLPRKYKCDKNYYQQGVTMVGMETERGLSPQGENINELYPTTENTPAQQQQQQPVVDDSHIQRNPPLLHAKPTEVTQQYSVYRVRQIAPPQHDQNPAPRRMQSPTNQELVSSGKPKIRTITDALKHTASLKEFAVEKGSVTLIGLMTAMEHELQREKQGIEKGQSQNTT